MKINNAVTLCQALANTSQEELHKVVKNLSSSERKTVLAGLEALKFQITFGFEPSVNLSDDDCKLIITKLEPQKSNIVKTWFNRLETGFNSVFRPNNYTPPKKIFDSLAIINSKSPIVHGIHDIDRKETNKLATTKLMHDLIKKNFEKFAFEFEGKNYTFERSDIITESHGDQGDQEIYWCKISNTTVKENEKTAVKDFFYGVNYENSEILVKDENWKMNPYDLLEAACKAYQTQLLERIIFKGN
jgi:hypothetical protein